MRKQLPVKRRRTETLVPVRVYKRELRRLQDELTRSQRQAADCKTLLTQEREDRAIEAKSLRRCIDNERQHPHRLEEQVKTWTLALNRLGIGVRLIAEWVLFRRGGIDVRLHWNDLIVVGIPAIIKMFDPIQASSFDPQNNIDGVEGWRHPDDLENDRNLALEQANKNLGRVGLRVTATGPAGATISRED